MPKLSEWRGVIAAVVCLPYVFGGLFTNAPDGHANGLPVWPVQVDSRQPTSPPASLSIMKVHRAQILGSDDPSGRLLSMPWQLVAIHDAGRALVVYYVAGDGQPHGVYNLGFRVIETPQWVEILAVSRTEYHEWDAEPAPLAVGAARIFLSASLGYRALLHGPTDWSDNMLRD